MSEQNQPNESSQQVVQIPLGQGSVLKGVEIETPEHDADRSSRILMAERKQLALYTLTAAFGVFLGVAYFMATDQSEKAKLLGALFSGIAFIAGWQGGTKR